MSQMEKMTGGELVIGPGSMYTTLKILLDAGLISMVDREAKTYLITLAGKIRLLDDYERRKKIVDQSSSIIKGLEV